MVREFRDFLMRGNVVDLAVAVVIGGAFTLVVGSFVGDILTPLLGLIGVPDFSTLTIVTSGGAVIAYGNFLNALVAFILVAAAIFFFVIKPMNALEKRRQAGEIDTPYDQDVHRMRVGDPADRQALPELHPAPAVRQAPRGQG